MLRAELRAIVIAAQPASSSVPEADVQAELLAAAVAEGSADASAVTALVTVEEAAVSPGTAGPTNTAWADESGVIEIAVIDAPAVRETVAHAQQAETAFDAFVRAMVDVALARGATKVAATLPALLEQGDLRREMGGGSAARLPSAMVDTARAWSAVLRGVTVDLAACGTETLDRWAAGLLAAVIGVAAGQVEELRRELRRRGVAAFGMIEHAA
jgi:hypothetical protein